MPFEPIRTDEPHSGPKIKQRDLDSQMLAGCSAFVSVSMLSYALAVWPHFVFFETHRLSTLGLACAMGMGPASIFGGYATRKFGLAAAGGFVSGSLATSVFLFLNLKRILLMENIPELNQDLPKPEFPSSWQYLVPLAWMLAVLVLTGLLLKREEFSLREN